jgi:hypothetical protein
MRHTHRTLLLIALLLISSAQAPAQQQQNFNDGVVTGSLSELRSKRRVLLIVRRSAVLDVSGQAKAILSEVFRSNAETRPRFPRLYNALARHLNKYMTKYQSISAAHDLGEAEFIVFFNLIEYRWPLGTPYPYGELFVILNDRTEGARPHIIWKTRKSPVWAEDAIKEFIRDLKAARGEG